MVFQNTELLEAYRKHHYSMNLELQYYPIADTFETYIFKMNSSLPFVNQFFIL